MTIWYIYLCSGIGDKSIITDEAMTDNSKSW